MLTNAWVTHPGTSLATPRPSSLRRPAPLANLPLGPPSQGSPMSQCTASGSQKCPFCRFMLSFLTAGSTCNADLGMMKPPENTATCPFSTKLSTESSGRRTFAASNAISTLAPFLAAYPTVLWPMCSKRPPPAPTRGSLTDPGLRRQRHCPPSPNLHCVWSTTRRSRPPQPTGSRTRSRKRSVGLPRAIRRPLQPLPSSHPSWARRPSSLPASPSPSVLPAKSSSQPCPCPCPLPFTSGAPISIGMGPWPRACRVTNTLRTFSRTSWKFEGHEACNTRWVFWASSVMPFCTSATLRAEPAKQHLELVQRCTRVTGELVVKQFLQQSTLPPCGSWLVLVQQSPPYDSTLSVTRVLQQLPRTLQAHHDQHVVQLSTESSRVRIHVDVAHCCHVPGFSQNQHVLQATVDGSTVSYNLELERPPTCVSPIERHNLAQ